MTWGYRCQMWSPSISIATEINCTTFLLSFFSTEPSSVWDVFCDIINFLQYFCFWKYYKKYLGGIHGWIKKTWQCECKNNSMSLFNIYSSVKTQFNLNNNSSSSSSNFHPGCKHCISDTLYIRLWTFIFVLIWCIYYSLCNIYQFS